MVFCPNGHGPKEGRFCPECGGELVSSLPAGDSLRIGNREAHANASVNPTFILPGAAAGGGPPVLVKCPKCGHRNSEADVFDCQGPCGRANLCRRHFDEEYDLCKDCAAERRGVAQQEATRQAKLVADLAEWRARAEQAETEVRVRAEQLAQAQSKLSQEQAKLGQAQETAATAQAAWQTKNIAQVQALDAATRRAEQAEAEVRVRAEQLAQAQSKLSQEQAKLGQAQETAATAQAAWQTKNIAQVQALDAATRRADQAEVALAKVQVEVVVKTEVLTRAQAELTQIQFKLAGLEKTLAEWRGRAERAEVQLAEIAAKARVEAEAQRQAAAKREQAEAEAKRRTAEAAKGQPIWQRIGIELLRVPAGEFLYGENKQKIALPEYHIARTPVTNAQYKAFVDAVGCPPPQHWSGGQIPQGKENHPVVNVDWQDAQNFCAWAGVRLPTEQEWEKAARGTDGRDYPWGGWQAGRCNSSQAKIGDTTPVDRYLNGASPYGALDMAGNVWEWCEDLYQSDQVRRVLRGGSFRSDARAVRCACRSRRDPEDRYVYLGFRVASPGL